MDVEKRFWSKVKRGTPEGCWEWQGCRDNFGYGKFKLSSNTTLSNLPSGKTHSAHRVAFALVYGGVPGKLCVLHRCDNPPCCNPKHLVVGDRVSNALDRDKKGRTPKGGAHYCARLTEQDVITIRDAYAAGESVADLAARFNVKLDSVYKLLQRKNWKHVTGGAAYVPRPHGGKGEKNPAAVLTEVDVRAIRRRAAAGEKDTAVAAAYGVDRGTVSLIRRRVTWTNVA